MANPNTRLTARRKAAGLSRRGLASKAGIVDSTIGALEKGTNANSRVRYETALKIANALNVEVADLFAAEDIVNQSESNRHGRREYREPGVCSACNLQLSPDGVCRQCP